jgi:hypothetical protein
MTSGRFCKMLGVVLLGACTCAFAQYGGGTGGGTSGGTTSNGAYAPGTSYGHGALIGGVVGGAAGGGALLLLMHHRHAAVVGCVASDGKTMTADNGKHTYQLTGSPVTGGERVSVVGKKSKGPSGIDELEVKTVKKDLGQCQQQQAAAGSGGQI